MRRLLRSTVGLVALCFAVGSVLAGGSASSDEGGDLGEMTYLRYCALCHGTGTGPGMFADALKKAAPDLTEIAKRNGGQFPEERVAEIIRNGGISGHGTMRILAWEKYFRSDSPEERADQLVQALTDYLKKHQTQ
jgi:mono/diheme cytochrome c family protein